MESTAVTGDRMVSSGACLARTADGEIIFVNGLLPGESAQVEVTRTKGRVRFGEVISLDNVSPDRVEPPCPNVARGCGGCDWQHISLEAQLRLKRDIVVDALTRVGKVLNVGDRVQETVAMTTEHYRTTARIVVRGNEWGFRKSESHEMVPIDECLVLHNECRMQVNDVLASTQGTTDEGEVMLRRAPDTFHEVSLRLSPPSFFQSHIDAPTVLSQLVISLVDQCGSNLKCVDLYSGVGVFAIALAKDGHSVIAVEGNPHAVGDARKNVAELDVSVVHRDVRKFRYDEQAFGGPCDVVIADPSREGVSKEAIEGLLSCNAPVVVLVSCDPASGARDVKLLTDEGYELLGAIPIDMFGYTHHVETVSILKRVQ